MDTWLKIADAPSSAGVLQRTGSSSAHREFFSASGVLQRIGSSSAHREFFSASGGGYFFESAWFQAR